MNTFGRLFRVSLYGESHGDSIGVLIDGCPNGIKYNADELIEELKRRKPGKKGTTTRIETDEPIVTSGIFNGYTTGVPINIIFKNNNFKSKDYSELKNKPRPGHSDFTAYKKYSGYNDYRGGGHFSGRLTIGLIAAGYFAKKIIEPVNISAYIKDEYLLEQKIEKAINQNDSLGAIIECKTNNIDIGLGEPFFDKIQAYIAHIIFSIPGIKGIEFGAGFNSANMFGSEMNDEIIDNSGKTKTNNSGGINGGISNRNELIFRVAIKPTSSIGKTQKTINIEKDKYETLEIKGRHDVCFALRVPPVIEAATAIALCDLKLINNSIYKR